MAIRILLADDHAIVRDGLRSLLETAGGMEVVGEAEDGQQAIERCVELKPDVVVMDIAMPKLNGIDATRELRDACPTAKVIVLSMHATKEHVYQALRVGVRGYLVKQSAGQELIEAVQVVCGEDRHYLSPAISQLLVDDYVQRGDAVLDKTPLEHLSPREREILQMLVEGKSSNEIGRALDLSPKTVYTHRTRLMAKLGTSDLSGLIKFAIQHGLLTLD